MTVTQDQTTTGVGRIARVTGPVVDVEFPPDAMPAIYNALSVGVSRIALFTAAAHFVQRRQGNAHDWPLHQAKHHRDQLRA